MKKNKKKHVFFVFFIFVFIPGSIKNKKNMPTTKEKTGQAQSITVLHVARGPLADLSRTGPSLPREVGAHGTRSGRSAPRTALKGTQGSKPRPRRELQYSTCCAVLHRKLLCTKRMSRNGPCLRTAAALVAALKVHFPRQASHRSCTTVGVGREHLSHLSSAR